MNIAIIDDEKYWREIALENVKELVSQSDNIVLYNSGIEFLQSQEQYDVVIIDIEMPGKNGFEILERYNTINKDYFAIILTTHTEYARKGYVVNAFRFIDKTNMFVELEEAFDKIENQMKIKNAFICGYIGESMKNILIKDILFIESYGRDIIIHTENQQYASRDKMSMLEDKLKEYYFYRCHKSYLINVANIDRLDENFAFFKNGEKAYISVRRRITTKKLYVECIKKIASG